MAFSSESLFQAWIAGRILLRVKETRQNKNLEPRSDFITTGLSQTRKLMPSVKTLMPNVLRLCGTESGTYKYVAAPIALDLADRQHHACTFAKLDIAPVHERSIQYRPCVKLDQSDRKGVVETGDTAQHAREVEERPGAVDLDPLVRIGIQVSLRIRDLTRVAGSAAHQPRRHPLDKKIVPQRSPSSHSQSTPVHDDDEAAIVSSNAATL
jgi:hypothetical protein